MSTYEQKEITQEESCAAAIVISALLVAVLLCVPSFIAPEPEPETPAVATETPVLDPGPVAIATHGGRYAQKR